MMIRYLLHKPRVLISNNFYLNTYQIRTFMNTYKDPSFELQNIPLTEKEAEIRHSQIKDVSYELQIAMP